MTDLLIGFRYFEVYDCFRRLLLGAIPILILRGQSMQLIVLLLISLLSVAALMHTRPYIHSQDNLLSILAQWSITFAFIAALMIQINSANQDSNPIVLSVLLIIFNLFILAFGIISIIITTKNTSASSLVGEDDSSDSDNESDDKNSDEKKEGKGDEDEDENENSEHIKESEVEYETDDRESNIELQIRNIKEDNIIESTNNPIIVHGQHMIQKNDKIKLKSKNKTQTEKRSVQFNPQSRNDKFANDDIDSDDEI